MTETAFALFDGSVASRSYRFDLTTTASTAARLAANIDSPSVQVRIRNRGSHDAYVGFGNASNFAVTVPAVGVPGTGTGIAAGGVEVFTVPGNAYWSFVAGSSTTIIEITVGVGI